MAKALIGRWGKNLGVRFPAEIEKAMNLKLGEEVEFQEDGADLVLRRPDARTREQVHKAVQEIKRMSRGHSLGDLDIRKLIGRDDH